MSSIGKAFAEAMAKLQTTKQQVKHRWLQEDP